MRCSLPSWSMSCSVTVPAKNGISSRRKATSICGMVALLIDSRLKEGVMRIDWSNHDDPNTKREASVFDLDAQRSVGECVWADDESGEYAVMAYDENGILLPCNVVDKRVVGVKCRGRIKIVFADEVA